MNKYLAVVAVVAALLVAGSSGGLLFGSNSLLSTVVGSLSPTGVTTIVSEASDNAVKSIAANPTELVNLTPPTDAQVEQVLTDLFQFVRGTRYLSNLFTAEAIMKTVMGLGTGITTLVKDPSLSGALKFLFGGVTLGAGEYTNNVGVLGLPTYTLCPLGIQYKLTSCVICNQDCQVAHNARGGKCGKSPITGGDTCLCAYTEEEAAARNISTSSGPTCDSLNPIVGTEDVLIGAAFRVRFAVQCLVNGTDATGAATYDNTGCNADCSLNHGSPGGECLMQYPLVSNAVTYNDRKSVYCICKNADGSLGSGTPEGPAGPPTTA